MGLGTVLSGHVELLSRFSHQVGPPDILYSCVRSLARLSEWARQWLCSIIKQVYILWSLAGQKHSFSLGCSGPLFRFPGYLAILNRWAGLLSLFYIWAGHRMCSMASVHLWLPCICGHDSRGRSSGGTGGYAEKFGVTVNKMDSLVRTFHWVAI